MDVVSFGYCTDYNPLMLAVQVYVAVLRWILLDWVHSQVGKCLQNNALCFQELSSEKQELFV